MYSLLTAFSLQPRDCSARMMTLCLKMLWRPSDVKKCTLLRENIRAARHTSLPEEKLEVLPMDMLPVELPFLKLSLFSSESLLLASSSAAATSILFYYF